MTKLFSNQFFKIFYKLLSPYRTKISIFKKSVSDNFFYSQNMFHNISRWLKPKFDKNFFNQFFKIFYKLLSPYRTKISIFEKSVSDKFFHSQNMFHKFSRRLKPKNRQKFFEPIFQNFLQVIVPLSHQNFNFWKKCFRQIFSLTKHVSQIFTSIKAKKSTKVFRTNFSNCFLYKCFSTPIWGTKKFFFKNCILAKKIGGTFYSDFQNFQMSHPIVVGPRENQASKNVCPPPLWF